MQRNIVPDIVSGQQTLALVPPTATVREAVDLMAKRHIGAVMVVSGSNRLEGIFTERDVLMRVVARGRDPGTTRISEVMTANPETIAPDLLALDALQRMKTKGFRHLPVVDDGKLVGIVSIRDLYDAVTHQLEEDIQEREAFIFGTAPQVA
jgi:CBS domain-containing protein